MLEIKIEAKEGWDASKNEFVKTKPTTLCLEHSLVSLSKWEAKYKKPFLSSDKTEKEIRDYIRMMTITQNVDDNIYNLLSSEEFKRINEYISDTMTATWFNDSQRQLANGGPVNPTRKPTEKITSELIYYWMISYQIPFECQKWHLNRLLTLIRVCNVKESQQNDKSNKMSKRDILSQNKALNAARRQHLGSRG